MLANARSLFPSCAFFVGFAVGSSCGASASASSCAVASRAGSSGPGGPGPGPGGPGGPGAISGMLAQCGAITAMLNAGTSRVSNGLHFGFHYATDLGLTKLGRHQVCSNVSRCFNAQLA